MSIVFALWSHFLPEYTCILAVRAQTPSYHESSFAVLLPERGPVPKVPARLYCLRGKAYSPPAHRRALTRCTKSLALTGLVKKSTAPVSKPRSLS